MRLKLSLNQENALLFQFVNGWLRHVQTGLYVSLEGTEASPDIVCNDTFMYSIRLQTFTKESLKITFLEHSPTNTVTLRLNCNSPRYVFFSLSNNFAYVSSDESTALVVENYDG
jgi:hypothetical protein